MSWSFTKGQSKQSLLQELTSRGIAHAMVNGREQCELYAVETVEIGGVPTKIMVVYLLSEDPGYGWGCAAFDEQEGPYYFDCPAALLELCDPPASPGAQRWRARVRGELPRSLAA